ncbi:MAG TPA: PTS transporter subunit EIIC [Candidatus Blautia excrementipullorum]|nr:PTS transporter subunit EIIC [Candidatus Blautia excrementipullorum]
MDYEKAAPEILKLCGGSANISSVTHCATRLRFYVLDKQKVNVEQVKKVGGVLGTVYSGDELQIVLGKNLIPMYERVLKLYEEEKASAEPETAREETQNEMKSAPTQKAGGKKRAAELGSRLIGFVSAAVTPMIPGLVGGGILKTLLLLVTLAWPAFEEMSTYNLLSMVANVPFYFMPVFVAYGAAKKLNATPIFSMVVTAALVYPDFVEAIGSETGATMLGFPVMDVTYTSTLLPALLISVCAYYVEKLLVKIIPGIIRPLLLGVGTMSITFALGTTVLGPLGDFIGSYVVNIFLWSGEHLGPVAVGILAGCMPFLVMTGMHHAVTPFMVQAISDPGYDVLFRPAYLLHNMAEGGACLGVALRAKNKALKAECFSLAVGCIVAGVTEPAIYGVNLPLRKPIIGVVAGAASGGVVAGILGATAYVYGYSTILAIPIFQQTIMAIVIAIAVAIIVAAAVTFVLGFDESQINR